MLSVGLMCSILSCFMSNPLSMGLLLVIYSFMISFFIGKVMLSSWFCIIIILMMIGGLLVIFMYISSISSNESFKFSFVFFFFFFFFFFLMFDEMLIDFQTLDSISMDYNFDLSESFSMVKLYNNSCMMLTIFMIIYLVFTMIVVSFIVKHYKGPLRSFIYE
nr:NADH dehydrogenase subunit 6 [Petalocephala eurglobata]